jgi:hypothetical protein
VRLSRKAAERSAAYNLFRRKATPDLYCAAPEDHVPPRFLSNGWEGVGRITATKAAFPGFRADQARAGVRLNGFYLFMAHRARLARPLSAPDPELWDGSGREGVRESLER